MDPRAYKEMAEVEERLWWYVARRRVIGKIMDAFIGKRKMPPDILEVGCGSGGNLPVLAAHGNLFAAEHDPVMRELAARRGCCPVLPATLPAPLPFSRRFDFICLFDVLEHLDARTETLTMLKNFLAEKSAADSQPGKLIISVPAFMFLWSPHDDAVHHQLRYTLPVLRRELDAAGYRVCYASYFNTLLFPAVWLFRLFRKWFGEPKTTDFELPPPLLNNLFTAIFSLEKFLLPTLRLPFGVSLLVVAESNEESPSAGGRK